MFLTTVEIPDISVDIKSIKQMLDGFDPVSLLPSMTRWWARCSLFVSLPFWPAR